MNRIAQIFKKDAMHLWPRILVFVATLVLFACEDPTYVQHDSGGFMQLSNLLYILLPLSCWLLVTSLIQEEKTIGHEQYWLTRPFTWTDLLAAKVLFLLVFVVVPLFLCQAAALAANGFPPFEHLGDLVVKQVFFAALLLLPMAAVGTVTKNLGRAFLGGLLLATALGVGAGMAAVLTAGAGWGGLAWIRETAVAAIVLSGSVAAIVLQYTRRRTVLACGILAGVAALTVLVWVLPPWQPAFVIQSWFSERQINPRAVRIYFDPRRDAPPAIHAASAGVYLEIPIRIENLPPDLDLVADWTSVESPWSSGWSGSSWISQGSSGRRLVVTVDPSDFERFQNAPIRLRGSLDLTLIATDDRWQTFGQCWMRATMVSCLSPHPRARLTRVYGDGSFRIPIAGTEVYAPYPTSPWFGPIQKYSAAEIIGDTRLVVERPVAHIERSFDLGPLRLADYRVAVD